MADKNCCDLRDLLLKELKDELDAHQMYHDYSEKMKRQGKDNFSTVLEHMSEQEFQHYLFLNAMGELMEDECGCSEEPQEMQEPEREYDIEFLDGRHRRITGKKSVLGRMPIRSIVAV